MNNIPQKQKIRRERIQLPFEHKKTDLVEWMYEKRTGLLTMVAVYLFIGIVWVGARIEVGATEHQDTMFIDLEDLEEQIEDLEQQLREQERFEEMFSSVQNTVSNDNAELNSQLRDAAGTQASDIYEEAERVQARMRANRDAYLESLAQQQAETAKPEAEAQNEQVVDRKVAGNVTVSFSLEGRSAAYLHVPAYQCENGGAVTVDIVVDPSGRVISAAINRSSSTSDVCLREMAVNAARRSRFNVDQSAPDKQSGTISYIFVSQ